MLDYLDMAFLIPDPMLFTKALRRDLASAAGLIFAILFTIMLSVTLIRMLGRAANGKVDTASILPLLAFSAINLLPVLLTLSLFVAVLSTLSRGWRDSEMVIWQASGLSLTAWIKPVLIFAAPVIGLIAVLSTVVAPWANQQSSEFKQRFEQREDISQVAAGQFRESSRTNRVFFVEGLNDDFTKVHNVFVVQKKADSRTILVAADGVIEDDGKDRFLILQKGRRYEQPLTGPELSVMRFETHGIRLEAKAISLNDDSARVKPTLTLANDRTNKNLGELLWRIGTPISACLLVLLAIPLSYINPRVGSAFNVISAILIYFLYNSLQNFMQAYVSSGRISFWIAVWLVHVILACVIALFFAKRMTLGGLRSAFGLRRKAGLTVHSA